MPLFREDKTVVGARIRVNVKSLCMRKLRMKL